MKSKFTAFGVSKGDCFLLELEREDAEAAPFRVLVDTGHQTKEAADLLLQHLKESGAGQRQTLDVVTVTHTDADHLQGLGRVLDMNVNIPELWLPYITGRAANMAFKEPLVIAIDTAELIANLPDDAIINAVRRIASDQEDKLKSLRGEDGIELNVGAERIGDLLLKELYVNLEVIASEDFIDRQKTSYFEEFDIMYPRFYYGERIQSWISTTESVIRCVFEPRWNNEIRNKIGSLELAMLTKPDETGIARGAMVYTVCKKAEQIKKTLKRAFGSRNGMTVRFFDYAGGIVPMQPKLSPRLPIGIINAKEKRAIPAGKDPSDVLALLSIAKSTVPIVPDKSRTNHTSLVLHAPATARYPAVLFSADSDFTFAQNSSLLTWASGMLITAPHHGSPKNSGLAQLYLHAHAANPALSSLWVRSDMKQAANATRPGDWWRVSLGASVGVKKYCTCCLPKLASPSFSRPESVVFEVDDEMNWRTKSYPCSC